MFARHVASVMVLAGATAALVGCSSGGSITSDEMKFTGPHASTFEEIWNQTSSEFAKEVIKDQEITDQEWAETRARMKSCIEDAGMTLDSLEDDGAIVVGFNQVSKERGRADIDVCKEDSGLNAISFLRDQLKTNPENRDIAELVAECLVRANVVEVTYNAEAYRRESQGDVERRPGISYVVDADTGFAALMECNSDPTNSFRN